jgi:predicted dehydrogenase
MARRVGIVGIGIMGTAMMRNLVVGGFEVVGYDVSEGAMARLAEAGGIAAASPRDVAEKGRDPDHLAAQCRCLRAGDGGGPGRHRPAACQRPWIRGSGS